MKILSTIAAATLIVASTGAGWAQTYDYLSQNRAAFRTYVYRSAGNGVLANGRCGGVSYGTGARSCGTATGGPVGGISSRN